MLYQNQLFFFKFILLLGLRLKSFKLKKICVKEVTFKNPKRSSFINVKSYDIRFHHNFIFSFSKLKRTFKYKKFINFYNVIKYKIDQEIQRLIMYFTPPFHLTPSPMYFIFLQLFQNLYNDIYCIPRQSAVARIFISM